MALGERHKREPQSGWIHNPNWQTEPPLTSASTRLNGRSIRLPASIRRRISAGGWIPRSFSARLEPTAPLNIMTIMKPSDASGKAIDPT
jgi:hypothetical protein